jgi:hypothetical protein
MGDSTDFYSGRGENKRRYISVVYKSGRKEVHDFGTLPAAQRGIVNFKSLGTVKTAKLLKGKPRDQ